MKLKSVATICKERKMVSLYFGKSGQYIGNETAFYLVPEKLELDQDNVLIIFDIPKDKQSCWMVEETSLPENISTADVLEGEEQAVIYQFDVCCYENTYRIIKDQEGIAVINTKYLAPLTDNEIELSYYIRRSVEGQEYIAVKSGLMLQAVITASNLNLFDQNFLDNLRDLQRECSHWINQHRENDCDRMPLYIDPETGEVEE
ncbi:hypothetical protein [Negativibacillus massiliensis]|uniref:hypothetical protein n=1 Tax=Negativibacillus massiliensis TaxID=1871035 RepID=UPI003AF2407D